MSERTLVWLGTDAARIEIARARVTEAGLEATGTQIGVQPQPYELRYELEPGRVRLQIVGGRSREVGLDDANFFDLEFSPLFNSLPVLEHGLHRGGDGRDFVMAFVTVPGLEVEPSEQRYEPLDRGRVRFRSGSFAAELEFDDEGFVVRYPGLADRAYPAAG